MLSTQKILFFDTYIISGTGEIDKNHPSFNTPRQKIQREIRGLKPIFKLPQKIDIVKYTLLSYSYINWDQVIIRFELEDKYLTKILRFLQKLFQTRR